MVGARPAWREKASWGTGGTKRRPKPIPRTRMFERPNARWLLPGDFATPLGGRCPPPSTTPTPLKSPASLATNVEPWILPALVVAGFVASFIDSQVGGGGIITLPAYVLVGLPPHVALGTNKLGGTASALVATANYVHKGLVPLRQALGYGVFSLAGGALGVWLALRSDGSYLVPAVMVVMVAVTLWVLLRPAFGKEAHARPRWTIPAMAVLALLLGTYDGILGPGTGSMLLVALVLVLGRTFRQASGLGRALNLASNVSALAYFVAVGAVNWGLGIPVAISMAVGGYVGSHVNLKHGDRYLKPLFVIVAAAIAIRLAFQL